MPRVSRRATFPALWCLCVLSGLLATERSGSLQSVRPAFDVASVKPNTSNAPATSRFPLGPGDAYAPGTFFSASNQPLIVYLRFAFKLGQGDLLDLPGWVYNDRFDIEARTAGTPTKDDMRVMMQSLLIDRFGMRTHMDRRSRPVFSLVLVKAGSTGPQLHVHPDDTACSAAPTETKSAPVAPSPPSPTSGLQLPSIACGSLGQIAASTPGRGRIGGKRVTIRQIAGLLRNPFTGVDRQVVDETGLAGTFDFSLEWSLVPDRARPPDATQPLLGDTDDTRPTLAEALQNQLGLTLVPSTGEVDIIVIDTIQRPTAD